MTTPTINIPPGWRRLRGEEFVAKGDKLYGPIRSESRCDASNIKNWDPVLATVGEMVHNFPSSTAFIRPEPEPAPAPEKEWLNPWE